MTSHHLSRCGHSMPLDCLLACKRAPSKFEHNVPSNAHTAAAQWPLSVQAHRVGLCRCASMPKLSKAGPKQVTGTLLLLHTQSHDRVQLVSTRLCWYITISSTLPERWMARLCR